MNAIDMNILVYALSEDEEQKALIAQRLPESLDPANTVLLWQVAVEFGAVMSRFARQNRISGPWEVAWRNARLQFPLALPQASSLERAGAIRATSGVSYWDSLILAACVDAGVTRFYTEDRRGRSVIEGVELVDPFA